MREGPRQVHEGGKLARNYGSANIELFIECWKLGRTAKWMLAIIYFLRRDSPRKIGWGLEILKSDGFSNPVG